MAQTADKLQTESQLKTLNEALGSGGFLQIRRMLNGLPPADAAHLIESTPHKIRSVLWQLIDIENEGDILQHLNDEVQSQFLRQMDAEEVATITEGLEADDIADILQQLPDRVIREVLDSMDHQDRIRVEHVLSYDEDSAGGLMNTDTITVRPNITLDVALRYLRRHEQLPEMTDSLLVVNRNDQYIGVLSLRKLLVSDPSVTVREIMDTEVEPIPARMSSREVATLFARHDWVSAPVVDDNSLLLGRITIDDVVDVIREESDHSLMSMAGLDEDEDTFAAVLTTAPRRAVWLGIHLLPAFIASAAATTAAG